MAPKNTMHLNSNFPAVKKAAYETVQHARKEALAEGIEESRRRLDKAITKTGYDIDPFVVEWENLGHQSGRIFVPADKWYYKFFEWGSVYIPATPFIRPAHRKMRKVFLTEMGENLDKFITRRAGLKSSGGNLPTGRSKR